MTAESEALDEVVGILSSMLRPGDSGIRTVVTWQLGPHREGETRAYTPNGRFDAAEGRHDRVVPPREFYGAVPRLRAAMARPGAGAWFSAQIHVAPSGEVTTAFDYDREPAWTAVPRLEWLVADLAEFPRDAAHTPAWLTDRLAGIPVPRAPQPPPTGRAALPELPAREWKLLAPPMSERFVAALDLTTAVVPRGAEPFLRLPKDFSLVRSGTAAPVMSQLIRTLSVYGELERAGRAVSEFRVLPYDTRLPEPSSWVMAIQVVLLFARRAADAATVDLLDGLPESMIPRSELTSAYFDGTILRNPLDPQPYTPAPVSDRMHASSYLLQIGTLASMREYGGSSRYPIARLDAEIDRYLAALFAPARED